MNKKILLYAFALIAVLVGLYYVYNNVIGNTQGANSQFINQKELTDGELENLYYIREEEKLAYDVYERLGDKWGIQAFQNISNSEERHQSQVVQLLINYNFEDKSKNLQIGQFNNPDLQMIFEKFMEEGSKSLLDALYVGATIEIMDIQDLDKLISETEKADLIAVYEKLKMGSENHLAAFKKQISRFENFNEDKLIKIEIDNQEMKNNIMKVNLKNSLIVDVRTEVEFASGNFSGSINIPLSDIENGNISMIKNTDKENIIVVCRSGARASEAENILKNLGVNKKIVNIGAWQNLESLK